MFNGDKYENENGVTLEIEKIDGSYLQIKQTSENEIKNYKIAAGLLVINLLNGNFRKVEN
jgi:hypothetical protein